MLTPWPLAHIPQANRHSCLRARQHVPLKWEAHASAPNFSATDFTGCLTRYSRGPGHRYTLPFATFTLHLTVGTKASGHQTYICCRSSDRNINFPEDFREKIAPNLWGEHPFTGCGPPPSLWSPRSPTPESLLFQSSGKSHIIFSPLVLTPHTAPFFVFPLSFFCSNTWKFRRFVLLHCQGTIYSHGT